MNECRFKTFFPKVEVLCIDFQVYFLDIYVLSIQIKLMLLTFGEVLFPL